MKISFRTAMLSYALLATIVGIYCDGKIRLAAFILLGGLAAKTCIARAAGWR